MKMGYKGRSYVKYSYHTHIHNNNKKGGKKLLEVIDLFMAWIVVMVSKVYTYSSLNSSSCKIYGFFLCQSHLNKVA